MKEDEATTEKFEDFFRMTPESFEELFRLLEPRLTKQTAVRNPIPARTRLEITLRYLATGDSNRSLSFLFRVVHSTISIIISETCEIIWDVLVGIVFPDPTEEMWLQKAREYEILWNFLHCIGSIDGKHVNIQVNVTALLSNIYKLFVCIYNNNRIILAGTSEQWLRML